MCTEEEFIAYKKSLLDYNQDKMYEMLCHTRYEQIIEKRWFYFKDPDKYKQTMNMVKRVIACGDCLTDIPELTPEADWSIVVPKHYGLIYDGIGWKVDVNSPKLTFDEGIHEFILRSRANRKKELIKDKCSKAGKASKKNNTITIMLENKNTGKVLTFDCVSKCAKFLKVSDRTVIRILKNEAQAPAMWIISKCK